MKEQVAMKEQTIHPESIRIAAYVMFWLMVLSAVILSTLLLPAGLLETSPLNMVLGYNNICVYWDYPEVEQYISMLYPFVEIPLVVYVALLQWRWHLVPHSSQTARIIGGIAGAIATLFALWFRLIFVHKAFGDPIDHPEKWPIKSGWAAPESVFYHTLPFWGLQIALAIVAVQNFHYYTILDAINKKGTGNYWQYTTLPICYVVSLILVTICKLSYGYAIYSGMVQVIVPGTNPVVPTTIGVMGRHLDTAWMFLAAVMPLLLAIRRRSQDEHSKLRICFHG